MYAKAEKLHKVIDNLNETQLDALYKIVISFMSMHDFDYISPEQSDAINRSFEEIRRGECVSFENTAEMLEHFGF